MATSTIAADAYIDQNVIVAEDWLDADDAQKLRILNVAERTITGKYIGYTIPAEAVYEFCAVLATNYNDTNKLQAQGIAGFSVTSVASFTFKQSAEKSLEQQIPKPSIDRINADPANVGLPKLSAGRSVKWTVM